MSTPAPILSADYELVASEYYDSRLHPTCAAFRAADRLAVTQFVRALTSERVVEVGAGASQLLEISPALATAGRLTIVDYSLKMIRHPNNDGARSIRGDANALPLAGGSADVVVALLADPFNEPSFWIEVHRVLRDSGRFLVTFPSFEWSSRYRADAGDASDRAVFRLASGDAVALPSFVRTQSAQTTLIRSAHLGVDEIGHVALEDLGPSDMAPKLNVLAPSDPVLTYYKGRR